MTEILPLPARGMTLGEARAIVGSIGFPSKMPGTSYGLSAHDCIAGRALAAIPGSICSDCYALRDKMTWTNVQKAYARRLAGITHPGWVAAMVRVLSHLHAHAFRRIDLGLRGKKLQRLGSRHRLNPMGYHRWHDSGDLQSGEHLEKIIKVCRRTPQIKHWLPTREVAMLRACQTEIPENLTIRVSAAMVDGKPPAGWPLGSTVHTAAPPPGAHRCPAAAQDHQCGACRACWSKDVPLVSYAKH